MQAMSNGDIAPGATETQQLRISAPPGVCDPLSRERMRAVTDFLMTDGYRRKYGSE